MRYRTSWLWAATSCATVLLILAGGAAALSPGFTFQGQLQDGSGPRNGICDFRFALFTAASSGTQIGSTQQMDSVPVQNGLFTVVLNAAGQFGPTAFNGADCWLEISVRCYPAENSSFSAPFSPRQALTAVPYALYVAPFPPGGTRWTDNGDGTVSDHTTGLMWEKKTGTVGSAVFCDMTTCFDPRNVNNVYEWCADDAPENTACDNPGLYAGNPPDGGVFADFLARTNGMLCSSPTCTGLGGHTDWRVPTSAELKTIVASPCPGAGAPCIDPIFGPTVSTSYWSSTTIDGLKGSAWFVGFFNGSTGLGGGKNIDAHVRAVRGGL